MTVRTQSVPQQPALVREDGRHVWVVMSGGKPEYYMTHADATARAEQLAEADRASLVYRACQCVGVGEEQR